MGQPESTLLIDAMLDPLSRCFDVESAQRLLKFKIDPSVQARVDGLAERANEGLLTPNEHAEYEAYINAADFIAILQKKAESHLADIKNL